MKFAAIASVAVVAASHPEVEGMFDFMPAMPSMSALGNQKSITISPDPELEADSKWYVEGAKSFYEGYYKQFYKKRGDDEMSKCLDETTTQNMVNWGTIMLHPTFLTDNILNFGNDFALMTSGFEIMEDVMNCHFEKSGFDLMTFCSSDPDNCKMAKIFENLSKNMFVIMGKMTAMAETMQEFPAEDRRDFKE